MMDILSENRKKEYAKSDIGFPVTQQSRCRLFFHLRMETDPVSETRMPDDGIPLSETIKMDFKKLHKNVIS
jgi:hypothetical protein